MKATITTKTPFYTGTTDDTGNIRITRMMEIPISDNHEKYVEKDKLVELLIILNSVYTGCDWKSYGKKAWVEIWKNRLIVALTESNIAGMLCKIVKRVPIDEKIIPENRVPNIKYIIGLSREDNDLLLEWCRAYPDLVAIMSKDCIKSGKLLPTIEFDKDILRIPAQKRIPIIPGNMIRGIMRDLLMAFVIRTVYCDDPNKVLTKEEYDCLMSGGRLDSSKGFVDVESKRSIRTELPFLSIFGTMKGNEDLSGKIKIGIGRLDCNEMNEKNPLKAYDYLTEWFGTRTDDYEGIKTKTDKTAQMIYSHICVKAGASFEWTVQPDHLTKEENKWFNLALMLLVKHGHLGGMSRAGLGEVEYAFHDCNIDDTEMELTGWLHENSDAIRISIKKLGKVGKNESK